MRRLLASLLRASRHSEPTRLDALRELTAIDIQDGYTRGLDPARTYPSNGCRFMTKDEAAAWLKDEERLAEVRWREQEREQEREFNASKVVSITVRAVRS